MNLYITNANNYFNLKGSFSKSNLDVFWKEFQFIFEKNDRVTINIERLTHIDRDGINALVKLHNQSLTKQKSLSIIGMGNPKVYNRFKNEEAA